MAELLVVAVAVGALVLFFTEWIPPAATAVGVAAVLMVTGVLTPAEGLSGFSNEATVTVLCMLALAAAVQRTGLVNAAAHGIVKVAHGSAMRFQAMLLAMSGLVSGVLNNTPVVAVMTPVTASVAQRMGEPASRFLLPMAYASTLGGMLTLVGTSTTVLASSVWAGMGNERFRMFQFTHIGALVFAVGLVYLLLATRAVAPRAAHPARRRGAYVFEVEVPEGSSLVGQDPGSSTLVVNYDVNLVRRIQPDGAGETAIAAGDVLVLEGSRDDIVKIRDIEGMKLRPEAAHWLPEGAVLAEAVVTPGSLLDGRSLEDVRFRGRFDAVVVAVRRRRAPVQRLGSTRLVGGDVLLLRATPAALLALSEEMHLVVATGTEEGYRRQQAPYILAILASVVALAALDVLPLVVAALVGLVAAIVTGCLRLHELQDAVRWDIVLLIAGLVPLGIAMEKSGVAAILAATIADAVGHWHPVAIVAVLYLTTMGLTEALSNNATIVLMLPISVQVADAVGMEPFPVAVAVTFAASLAFMTPIGYQTHMMVFGPGEYRFTDYLRLGTPLNLICGAVAITAIHWTWPFT